MPHIDDYYYDKAKYLFDKDRYQEAEVEIQRGLRINSFNPTHRKLLGDIYYLQLEMVHYDNVFEPHISNNNRPSLGHHRGTVSKLM